MSTATANQLPAAETLSETLAMLLGEDVLVRSTKSLTVERTALYGSDDAQAVAALECDRAFAVFTGAKLLMVPAGRAKELAGNDEATDSIDEAFHEIANIAATWFQQGRDERTSLQSVVSGEWTEVTDWAEAAEYEIDVPGYGVGKVRVKAN